MGDSRRTIGRMANKVIFRAPVNPLNSSLSSPTIPVTQPITEQKIAQPVVVSFVVDPNCELGAYASRLPSPLRSVPAPSPPVS